LNPVKAPDALHYPDEVIYRFQLNIQEKAVVCVPEKISKPLRENMTWNVASNRVIRDEQRFGVEKKSSFRNNGILDLSDAECVRTLDRHFHGLLRLALDQIS
jgi:hypothetical protein